MWLANHATPIEARQVSAEIWLGTSGPGHKIAEASVTVSHGPPAQKYVFDFGTATWFFNLVKIMLKVVYVGPDGDTHVYWDSVSTPTGLFLEGTLGAERSTWGTIKALYSE